MRFPIVEAATALATRNFVLLALLYFAIRVEVLLTATAFDRSEECDASARSIVEGDILLGSSLKEGLASL